MTVRDDLCRAVWSSSIKKKLIMRVDVTDPLRVVFRFSHRFVDKGRVRKSEIVIVPEPLIEMFMGQPVELAGLVISQVKGRTDAA